VVGLIDASKPQAETMASALDLFLADAGVNWDE
jgi:hypothetical protein